MTSRKKVRRKRAPGRRYDWRIMMLIMATTAIAVAAVLALNASNGGIVESAKPVSVSLRLNGPLGARFAGEIVAARTGLYERNGLNLTLHEGAPGDDPVALVLSGVETFGVIDSIGFLKARDKGRRIVAFGASFVESAVVFYTLEKSGIRTPQDFVGKRVGRRPDTDSAILFDAMLKNVGLSRSQIVETTSDVTVEALLAGRVDVIPGRLGQEDFLLYKEGVAFTVIRVSDYGIHVPDAVYFAAETLVHDRPSVVRRFLQSTIAGWQMTYVEPAITSIFSPDGANHSTLDQIRFQLAAQRELVAPLSRRVAEFDEQQWKQLRMILTNGRTIDGATDLSQSINFDMLKEVYRKTIIFGN